MKELEFTTNFTTGGIEDIKVKDDPFNFRWVRGIFGVPTGLNYLDSQKTEDGKITLNYKYFNDLDLVVNRCKRQEGIWEEYSFTNLSDKSIDLSKDEYGLILTFADGQDIAKVSLSRRAYSRVLKTNKHLCVFNSRFGGQSDGVGLVLTSGEIGEYARVKYSASKSSEHTFSLPKTSLEPRQSLSFSWLIFHYENMDEFKTVVSRYMPLNTQPNAEDDDNSDAPFLTEEDLSQIKSQLAKQGVSLIKDESGKYLFWDGDLNQPYYRYVLGKEEALKEQAHTYFVKNLKLKKGVTMLDPTLIEQAEIKQKVLALAQKAATKPKMVNAQISLTRYALLSYAQSEQAAQVKPLYQAVTACPIE